MKVNKIIRIIGIETLLMKETPIVTLLLFFFCFSIFSQNNNGQLDDFTEFSTKETYSFYMDDSTILKTDVYLPITQDCLLVSIDVPFLGEKTVELIPKGTQYIIYDSLNGGTNPNPYQLPFIFIRTPYDKGTDEGLSSLISFMGYGMAVQDMRGRYASEGVYLPMYSDAWGKNAYHPDIKHTLDVTDLSDESNGNRHKDGYESLQYLVNQAQRNYDIDGDGDEETFTICNGSVGMTGLSALANSQYQLAAAGKVDPTQPGLKSIMPVVGTNEHYLYTAYNNGVFRESLVRGWLMGQLNDLDDGLNATDTNIHNDLHSSSDYNQTNKQTVGELCVDHFTTIQHDGNITASYPNSITRSDMDASFAPVDANGDGDSLGTLSRYSNMEVPAYHLTGWWDIFIDGQIATYNSMMDNLSSTYNNQSKQKLIIGPWAHQTIGQNTTGDITYPDNIYEFIGLNFNDFDNFSIADSSLSSILSSEFLSWFRYTLNYNDDLNVGEPKVIIPESNKWQNLGSGVDVRVPSKDYIITYTDFAKYLTAQSGLKSFPFEVDFNGSQSNEEIDVDPLDEPIISTSGDIPSSLNKDFTQVPNVRLYMVGPIDDGVSGSESIGNFWLATDSFPFKTDIQHQKWYLHGDSSFNKTVPTSNEGNHSYIHDPDDPVMTVGGANMLVNTPSSSRRSQGQMDLSDPELSAVSLDHSGSIIFESEMFTEPLAIAGFPKATIYASSTPEGSDTSLTDTDFFIKILDEYPDGSTYFVVEGAVNARARNYAKQLAVDQEDPNIPFTNIHSDSIYEYTFKMMPVGYVFGTGHKMKIMISSGNYPRYQSNPNLPIEDGEFFRRQPNDAQTYIFGGNVLSPRRATQSIQFSDMYPSSIELPVYKGDITNNVYVPNLNLDLDFNLIPNPAKYEVTLVVKEYSDYKLHVFNSIGQKIYQANVKSVATINIEDWESGYYIFHIRDSKSDKQTVKKLIKY